MLTSFVPLTVFAMITQTTFTIFMSYPAVPGNSDSFGGAKHCRKVIPTSHLEKNYFFH